MKIENKHDRHCPVKNWGWEEWVVNNDMYCGKRLHFTKVSAGTSMHFHMRKHETMYIEKGSFMITTINPFSTERVFHYLVPGDSVVIEPGVVHRIVATDLENGEAILVEFSTHHEDSDSYRVER